MAHPVDKYVGQRLRKRRTDLSISQEKLAQRSGITFQQVQKYERATNRISVSRLFEFASVLRVPISYFFEGIGSTMAESGMAEDLAAFEHQIREDDKDAQDILDNYRKIKDPEIRKSVKTLVSGIANGATVL